VQPWIVCSLEIFLVQKYVKYKNVCSKVQEVVQCWNWAVQKSLQSRNVFSLEMCGV